MGCDIGYTDVTFVRSPVSCHNISGGAGSSDGVRQLAKTHLPHKALPSPW